jgi:uncharacterized NAD(P)/FAD-binding protein YdhS
MRQLLGDPLTCIPKYGFLFDPAKIELAKCDLRELRSSTAAYARSVKAEIEGEPAELRQELDAVRSDADSVKTKMSVVCEKNLELLNNSAILWDLIRRAGDDNAEALLDAAARNCPPVGYLHRIVV